MTNRNIALAGSASVAVGLFLPIATFPIVGTVNLFGGGTNWFALSILALAIIGIVVALRSDLDKIIFPGLAIAAMLIYKFAMLQWNISSMRSKLTELKDNPFAGIAEAAMNSVQLQWGWLVLCAAAIAMVYAGVQHRKEKSEPLLSIPDGKARTVAGVSIALITLVPAYEIYHTFIVQKAEANVAKGDAASPGSPFASDEADTKAEALSAEETAYIAQNLKVYDLRAKYYDSLLDGRVPGVEFKVKNNGNRTLNRVTVRVVFQDKNGAAIAEEEYNPVWVTESGFGDDNKPLRPNYIWQQESDKFYTAKKVPNEWATGKATASVVAIEFGDAK